MALISCVECGHQVSDQAEACPNCGHPLKPRGAAPVPPIALPQAHLTNAKPKGRNTGCALIIGFVVLLVIVASCLPSRDRTASTAAPNTARAPASPEQERASLLKDAQNERLPLDSRIQAAQTLSSKFPGSTEGNAGKALGPQLVEQKRKENLGRQWEYRTNDDPMTGKKVRAAFVSSTNTHEFSFPYAGPQHARLTARKHPQHGSDIILSIERGQLQCTSYSGCNVMVRFGDGQPKRYKAYGPADNSSETLFIEGYADFLRRMQAVDTVRVQASVFQQGSPTWEFDVSGFDPGKMK